MSGKGGAGAGHCMWANEWEIGVVCRLCLKLTSVTTYPRWCKKLKRDIFKLSFALRTLGLTCLVLDQQAKDPDHRFVKVATGKMCCFKFEILMVISALSRQRWAIQKRADLGGMFFSRGADVSTTTCSSASLAQPSWASLLSRRFLKRSANCGKYNGKVKYKSVRAVLLDFILWK